MEGNLSHNKLVCRNASLSDEYLEEAALLATVQEKLVEQMTKQWDKMITDLILTTIEEKIEVSVELEHLKGRLRYEMVGMDLDLQTWFYIHDSGEEERIITIWREVSFSMEKGESTMSLKYY